VTITFVCRNVLVKTISVEPLKPVDTYSSQLDVAPAEFSRRVFA
jgi:hypothetical protein